MSKVSHLFLGLECEQNALQHACTHMSCFAFCVFAFWHTIFSYVFLCSSEVPYQDELNITATTESIGVGLLRSEPVKGELIIFFRFQNIINKCPSSAVDNALALATRFWYCYRIDINVSINS